MTGSDGDRRRFFADRFYITPAASKNKYELRRAEVAASLENATSEIASKYERVTSFTYSDENALRQKLIDMLNEDDVDQTRQAIAILGQKGWLKDGSLAGISLQGANLENVTLIDVVLHHVDLTQAKLNGSIFLRADLKNARFSQASLDRAIFENCDLENATMDLCEGRNSWLNGNFSNISFNSANLMDSILSGDFRNSSFVGANLDNIWLRRTDIRGVNLENASLIDCVWDGSTIDTAIRLPDGRFYRSILDDLGCFTNPNHSNFWKPSRKPLEKPS